jgi:hypothetical protein
MPAVHYRPRVALAASLSFFLAACGSSPSGTPEIGPSAAAAPGAPKEPREINTTATLWTMLGLAKDTQHRQPGPQTGSQVSPVLWQAALDTLHFTTFASEDPLGGSLVTDWYTPPDKPDERFRIDVFVLSRYLTTDALAVSVQRQVRGKDGQWADATVARKVEQDLETKILYRARQLRQKWLVEASS